MKTELIIILALAAALAFHREKQGSACGSAGCVILPLDFAQPSHFPNTSAAPPTEEIAVANPDAPR